MPPRCPIFPPPLRKAGVVSASTIALASPPPAAPSAAPPTTSPSPLLSLLVLCRTVFFVPSFGLIVQQRAHNGGRSSLLRIHALGGRLKHHRFVPETRSYSEYTCGEYCFVSSATRYRVHNKSYTVYVRERGGDRVRTTILFSLCLSLSRARSVSLCLSLPLSPPLSLQTHPK